MEDEQCKQMEREDVFGIAGRRKIRNAHAGAVGVFVQWCSFGMANLA